MSYRGLFMLHFLAEGTGFEPAVAFTTTVFKTVTFNHSVTPPGLRCQKIENFRQQLVIIQCNDVSFYGHVFVL